MTYIYVWCIKTTQKEIIFYNPTYGTCQIFITVAAELGLTTPSNAPGRCFKSNFLSPPIKLVKSNVPLLLPSASFFSQTWKQTPQLLIAAVRAFRWKGVLSHGRLLKLSSLSQLTAARTRFFVNTSVYQKEDNYQSF